MLQVKISARGSSGLHLWFEHNLDTAILFMFENVIALGRLIQAQAVSDDERRINFASLDTFKQRVQVAMNVCLSHPEGQALGECSPKGKLVEEASIHTGHRYCASFATGLDSLAESNRPVRAEARLLLYFIIH